MTLTQTATLVWSLAVGSAVRVRNCGESLAFMSTTATPTESFWQTSLDSLRGKVDILTDDVHQAGGCFADLQNATLYPKSCSSARRWAARLGSGCVRPRPAAMAMGVFLYLARPKILPLQETSGVFNRFTRLRHAAALLRLCGCCVWRVLGM